MLSCSILRQPKQMRQQTIRLRRARCLLLYWRDGRLFLHNFARRLTVSGRPITCGVLDFFGEWRTYQEAIAHFAGYRPRSVRSAISELVKHGLLLPKDSPEATQDSESQRSGPIGFPQGASISLRKMRRTLTVALEPQSAEIDLPKTPQPRVCQDSKRSDEGVAPETLLFGFGVHPSA